MLVKNSASGSAMGHIELSAELQHTNICSADQAGCSTDTMSAGATMVSERQQSGHSCSTSSSMSDSQPGICETKNSRPSSVRSRAAFFEALNTPPSPNSPPLSPENSSPLAGTQLRLVSRPTPCFLSCDSYLLSGHSCLYYVSRYFHSVLCVQKPQFNRNRAEMTLITDSHSGGQEVEMVDQGPQVH